MKPLNLTIDVIQPSLQSSESRESVFVKKQYGLDRKYKLKRSDSFIQIEDLKEKMNKKKKGKKKINVKALDKVNYLTLREQFNSKERKLDRMAMKSSIKLND